MAVAFSEARAGTLPPCPSATKAGLLLRETGSGTAPLASYAVLAGRRLLLFSSSATDVQQHGRAEAVLALRGLAEEVACVDAPRFIVGHGYGVATFVAGSQTERAAWVAAIADASFPGGCVTSEQVDQLLASVRDEAAAREEGAPASSSPLSTARRSPTAYRPPGRAIIANGHAPAAAGIGAEPSNHGRKPCGGASAGASAAGGLMEMPSGMPSGMHASGEMPSGEMPSGEVSPPAGGSPESSPCHQPSVSLVNARGEGGASLGVEVSIHALEARILTAELGAVDGEVAAVEMRLARSMAMVAKREHGGGAKGKGGGVKGGGAPASVAADTAARLAALSDEQAAARLVSERSVHAALIDEQADRTVKWERLVETVARLPIDAPPASPLRSKMPNVEAHLRLGSVFLAAWRTPLAPGAVAALAAAPPAAAEEGAPGVLVIDIRSAKLRLIEGGHETAAIPLPALPSLYPGYRASHFRTAAAAAAAPSASSLADSSAPIADAAIDIGDAASPPEACCFCLPGYHDAHMVPMHTDTPYERSTLLRSVRAATVHRPLAPFAPLHAGVLLRERTSRYWSSEHAILTTEHLLLLESPEATYPHRVLPLHGALAYHRHDDSHVFSIKAERWQVNFSARDLNGRQRWIDALSHVLPISVLEVDGTLGHPRRRPRIAQQHASLGAGLVHVRALQRSLAAAEGSLTEARQDADARVAAAIDSLEQLKSNRSITPSRPPTRTRSTPRGPPTPGASPVSVRGGGYDGGGMLAMIASPPPASLMATPPSAPTSQLWQLLEVNRALNSEIAEGEKDIRMLQRAVVLLSTAEWSRGEWVWFLRVAEGRTLWEVWTRAFTMHRQWQREAAAAERAAAAAAAPRAISGPGAAGKGASVPAAPEVTLPSTWSAWSGDRGVGIDSTNTASVETRRQAALAHDEDWFINFANKIFEL